MFNAKTIIGIDVGLTGALCILGDDGSEIIEDLPTMVSSKTAVVKNQLNGQALTELLRPWAGRFKNNSICYIEKQAARPKQGVASMFSLGHSYGVCIGVCNGLTIPFKLVSPKSWKNYHKLTSDKQQSLDLAKKLFPSMTDSLKLKKHHNRAESILIAAYATAKECE